MVHFVPATVENVTEVVAYVLDERHRSEMKAITKAANAWCKRTANKEHLLQDSISQLSEYEKALQKLYGKSWTKDWAAAWGRIWAKVGDDIEDCVL